jgi:hypothetical protein
VRRQASETTRVCDGLSPEPPCSRRTPSTQKTREVNNVRRMGQVYGASSDSGRFHKSRQEMMGTGSRRERDENVVVTPPSAALGARGPHQNRSRRLEVLGVGHLSPQPVRVSRGSSIEGGNDAHRYLRNLDETAEVTPSSAAHGARGPHQNRSRRLEVLDVVHLSPPPVRVSRGSSSAGGYCARRCK